MLGIKGDGIILAIKFKKKVTVKRRMVSKFEPDADFP